jgi:spore coat protein A, manganese oxidase
MVTRRQLLVAGGIGGATMLLPQGMAWAASFVPPPPLDPKTVPKYVTALPILPAMPPINAGTKQDVDEYLIGVRQFRQQILPSGLPQTTVWGYGSTSQPSTFNYPSFTINALVDRPVRVTWINQLVDERGLFLPHLLPVDPTLHWANPPGGLAGRDCMPTFASTPGPYTGPVPMVVHLHGAHSMEESDGYPEAWYLPAARDIPAGFATVGSFYDEFRDKFEAPSGIRWRPGAATFEYGNEQRATAEWFHDHTLGLTRQNMYAGPVGFYLLRGGSSDLPPGVLPGPAPAVGDPPDTRHYEIPLIVQDRSFYQDGALFYPSNRQFFDGYAGPYIPNTTVPPIWNPEFLANAIVVNGRTWPVLAVEQRRYRLRLVNACNSRFLILKIAANPTVRPAAAAIPLWQIGSDGGFLASPVRLERVFTTAGQRVDAIVDFTTVPVGTELFLINEGPDGPARGGTPGTATPAADPNTTGQVMKFVVGSRIGTDTSVPPDQLHLPAFTPIGPATTTRKLSLNEPQSGHHHAVQPGVQQPSTNHGMGADEVLLGTLSADGTPVAMKWGDPITENPTVGSTEIWEFHNKTTDVHPVHVHGVQFQLIGRGPDGQRPPNPAESGYLDTVAALPGDITRIKAVFDRPGRFVWHCNVLEHEDNGMMRPYQVVPSGAPDTGDGSSSGANGPLAAAGIAALSVAALAGAALAKGVERRPSRPRTEQANDVVA